MKQVIRDLRFAVRQMLRRPGFTIVVVCTLALGIGASTAIVSTVNPILSVRNLLDRYSNLIGVATLLFMVGGFACAIPAARASKVDPATTLRAE